MKRSKYSVSLFKCVVIQGAIHRFQCLGEFNVIVIDEEFKIARQINWTNTCEQKEYQIMHEWLVEIELKIIKLGFNPFVFKFCWVTWKKKLQKKVKKPTNFNSKHINNELDSLFLIMILLIHKSRWTIVVNGVSVARRVSRVKLKQTRNCFSISARNFGSRSSMKPNSSQTVYEKGNFSIDWN